MKYFPCTEVSTWIGWLTGLVLLDRPWGIPRFSSWVSISSLISLTMFIALGYLMSDAVINAIELAENGQTSRLGIYIGKLAGTHRVIFYFITRLAFVLNAKKLGNLLNRLYFYPVKGETGLLLKETLKRFDCFIIISSYLSTIFATTFYMTFAAGTLGGKTNPIINWIGKNGYLAILSIFGILPIAFSDAVALGFIVAIIRAILKIFQDFCKDLENVLLLGTTVERVDDLMIIKRLDDSKALAKQNEASLIDLESEFKRYVSTTGKRNSQWKYIPSTGKSHNDGTEREKILQRFYEMVDMFELAGEVVSPFVFVNLVVATVELVSTVSSIFVIRHRGTQLTHDIIIMIKVAMHLCLLQVGHRVQISILKGKCLVKQAFIRASNKHGMRDVVAAVISWSWKLSGMGFFDVDRKLAAGIISLLLSYTVIIFQLQLALIPAEL